MEILYLIIGIIVVGAVILVIIGLSTPQSQDLLSERLAEVAESGGTISLEEIELSQPLFDRIVFPIARALGTFVQRFTPQNTIVDINQKLERAGNPPGLDANLFLILRLLGLGLGVVFYIIFQMAPKDSPLAGRGLIIGLLMALIGFYLPTSYLNIKIARRQGEIRRAMPDALDLLTICVEAGLGFDAAMAKVYEKWDNELGRAFGRVIQEIQLGKIRREALRDMADRLGIAEMTSFVAAVIQSEQLGVSMANVLRIQSDQMRVRRRQRAEEEAHKAPIKMLFPMAMLIFPSICIVLMTPAVIMIITSGVFAP